MFYPDFLDPGFGNWKFLDKNLFIVTAIVCTTLPEVFHQGSILRGNHGWNN